MSRLLHLGDDTFLYFLSWFDLVCICKLDIAIGNSDERLLWLRALHQMGSKAVDEYEHSHSSIRWLIRRGARATSIRFRGDNLEHDRITDQTFAGVGILSTQSADTNCSDDNAVAEGCPHLTSINLSNCDRISDIGVSAIAEGCRHLTSINLSYCLRISDTGMLLLIHRYLIFDHNY